MTALIVLGCILLFFILLALIPAGAELRYGTELTLCVTVCGIRFRIFPAKKKKKTRQRKPKKQKKPKPQGGEKPKQKKNLTAYFPLALDFLGSFRRKLLIRRLTLHAVFGGGDPADAALNYGRAWALIGNLMPRLRRAFRIRKEQVDAVYDPDIPNLQIQAVLSLSLTVGQALALAFRALRQFLQIKRTEKAVQKNEQSDQ